MWHSPHRSHAPGSRRSRVCLARTKTPFWFQPVAMFAFVGVYDIWKGDGGGEMDRQIAGRSPKGSWCIS
jgi:hypothetical protein